MFPKISILLLSGTLTTLICVNVALADKAILDEDTVGVGEISEPLEANLSHPRREGRDRHATYTVINGQHIMISCTTARNLDGECKPFGECYPMFKLREQRGNDKNINYQDNSASYSDREVNRVNDELQHIYRGISGQCSEYVLKTISNALGHPVPKQNYVCCPTETNYTRLNRPSRPQAPSNAQAYQNQQCGKYLSRAGNDSNTDSTNDGEIQGRIVNGRVAGRGEFPWAVAMMLNGRQFCGGSLIDANHVLTAAHCVYFMNRGDVKRMRLQIGDHNIYSTNDGQHENRGASNVYYHKAFSMRTLNDDVALIRLSSGVYFNRNIQPICLSSNSWGWESYTASVAGWGQTSENGQQSSVLRTVNVRIWKQNDCARRYKGRAPAGITNGMVCAGGQNYDSCKGDSGGPLNVWKNKRAEQLGIVSWGIGCGTFPGVYTRVDMYLNWINKNRR